MAAVKQSFTPDTSKSGASCSGALAKTGRGPAGQHLRKIERNLRRVIAIHRFDARHVVMAAPGSNVPLVVLGEDVEAATGDNRPDALVEHCEK